MTDDLLEEDFSVPDLVFEYPDCTVCEYDPKTRQKGEMQNDGGDAWYCMKCGAYWDRMGQRGKRDG